MNKTISKNRLFYFFAISVILLILPAIAMLFTNAVKWSLFDFMIAALLLFGTASLIEIFLRHTKSIRYRWLAVILILGILLLLWMELAVGIFGSPIAGN